MKIYVTRHGETDWNVQGKVMGKADLKLNAKGIQQAIETRDKLSDCKIDLIISSPLIRAFETAEIINQALNVNIITDNSFSERDFGEFEGMNRKDFDFEGYWSYNKNYEYQKAENIESFFKRVYESLDCIKDNYDDISILIVTHGGISIPINCYFNGIPSDDNLIPLALHNCEVTLYNVEQTKKYKKC